MKPNFDLILQAVTRKSVPAQVPLYEHFVDDQVIESVMGYDFKKINGSTLDGQVQIWKQKIAFYQQMGYVFIPVEYGPNFAQTPDLMAGDTAVYSKGERGWTDEHTGIIKTMADLDNPALWPEGDKAFDYELFGKIAKLVPPGMKIIGGASGGPFEHASFLVGLEPLCIMVYEDEEFVTRLFEKIGNTITAIADCLSKMPEVGVYRFGDDLGFKTATMLSPKILRQYVFPWQKKVVEAAHKNGKPFLLHSCGQLQDIMDDLIDDVKIDAKHSFEDVIMPVTEAKKKWGSRVALFGGVDVDFLCRHTPQEIKEHTKRILEVCAPTGGYAAGSGNTIANYIPVPNYLAMLQAVKEFNG